MAERALHLVGSYPAETAEDAMREILGRGATHLRSLSDGETGERGNWVVSIIESLRDHPDLRLLRSGDWSDYSSQTNFAVRRGHSVDSGRIDLGILANYRAGRATFERLRAEFDRPDLAYQVGVPGDLDLTMFAFGPLGVPRRRAFTEATAREIAGVHALGGDEVVFQLEIPLEQVLVARAPARIRPMVAGRLARGVTRLAARAPLGARFGVHLCLGDLGHKSLGKLEDTDPVVRLANAVAAAWPAGRPLEYVHFPLAEAQEPPTLDPAFYRPMGDLRLPSGTRVVAGFLHEKRDVDELRRLHGTVEDAVGRPVDIASSCGMGRVDIETARGLLDRGVALLDG